jgi:predicted DNA-binding transcriptional regulator YafY
MNRIDRLMALILYLQARPVVTARDIAAHFEIGERTVYRDIAALGQAGVPLVSEAGVGYRLLRDYFLPPVRLDSHEAHALITGGHLAEAYTNGPVRDGLLSTRRKLTALLPRAWQLELHHLEKHTLVEHAHPAAPYTHTTALATIQSALAQRKVLRLAYRRASDDTSSDRTVEPLGLVHYLNHWHLIAWCRLRGAVRDFRLDRISSSSKLAETAPPRPDFNLKTYLEENARPGKPYNTLLRFTPQTLRRLPIHWSPRLSPSSKKTSYERHCWFYDQAEAVSALLSWGTGVSVITPRALRTALAKAALAMAKHHRLPADTS